MEYSKEQFDKAIELMKDGASIVEVCVEIGVSRSQVYEDLKTNKALLDTIKKGKEYSEAWWARGGRVNLKNKDFNYQGWYMQMRNKFGWNNKQTNDKHNWGVKLIGNSASEKLAELIRMVEDRIVSFETAERQAALIKTQLELEALEKVDLLNKRLDEMEIK